MQKDLAALLCALLFAFCSLAFAAAARQVGALAVNQARTLFAVVVLATVHQLVFGELWPTAPTSAQLGLLITSGLIGLVLGDLCFFHALTVIGPRLGTLLMSTAPLFSVVGDGLLRDRWPEPVAFLWTVLIVSGVCLVLTEKTVPGSVEEASSTARAVRGSRAVAIAAGLVGAVCQGFGLVLANMASAHESADGRALDPLSMTHVRMLAGLAGILVVLAARRATVRMPTPAARRMTRRVLGLILVGTAFGPTVGVWLSMVAVNDVVDTGRPAALIALTPVLMIPIVWLVHGERPGCRGWFGTLLAFAGIVRLLDS